MERCENENGDQFVVKFFNLKTFRKSIEHAKFSQLKAYLAEAIAYEAFTYHGIDKVPTLIDIGKTSTGSIPFLVMEKLCRNLESSTKITAFKRFTVRSALKLSHQLVLCIEAIHSAGILHRDIKPDNFCFARHPLNGQLILKIIDFGCSKVYDPASIGPLPSEPLLRITGTYLYASRAAHLTSNFCPYDDLESLLYVIVRLFGGKLGWPKDVPMSAYGFFKAKTEFWEVGSVLFKPLRAIFTHIQSLA